MAGYEKNKRWMEGLEGWSKIEHDLKQKMQNARAGKRKRIRDSAAYKTATPADQQAMIDEADTVYASKLEEDTAAAMEKFKASSATKAPPKRKTKAAKKAEGMEEASEVDVKNIVDTKRQPKAPRRKAKADDNEDSPGDLDYQPSEASSSSFNEEEDDDEDVDFGDDEEARKGRDFYFSAGFQGVKKYENKFQEAQRVAASNSRIMIAKMEAKALEEAKKKVPKHVEKIASEEFEELSDGGGDGSEDPGSEMELDE